VDALGYLDEVSAAAVREAARPDAYMLYLGPLQACPTLGRGQEAAHPAEDGRRADYADGADPARPARP